MSFKKRIFFIILILVVIIDIIIITFLLNLRSFPRLAIWKIIESNNPNFFYWSPENAPPFFHFQKSHPNLNIFKYEIISLLKDSDSDLDKVLIVNNYLLSLGKDKTKDNPQPVIWSSPYQILQQIKEKKTASCYTYNILFSVFLSSIGINSRLWTLEGDDGLNRFGHTVIEVYIKDLNRWIMFDSINRIYFIKNNLPLSVLELREELLNSRIDNINIIGQINAIEKERLLKLYKRLLKMVFLRTGNDFVARYEPRIRYGKLYWLAKLFDLLPSDMRRGISYLVGRPEYLVHYIDKYESSLGNKIIFSRIVFYFLITTVFLVILFILERIFKFIITF